MLEKADDFRKYPNLFHKDSKFKFIQEVSQEIDLSEYLDTFISKEQTIFFNFSYFFASPTLAVESLILSIKRLSAKYPNRMVVLFQNPYNRETNEKWYDFKRYSTNFESSLGGEKYKKICHMKNTEIPSNRPRDTHLYYDIRLKK